MWTGLGHFPPKLTEENTSKNALIWSFLISLNVELWNEANNWFLQLSQANSTIRVPAEGCKPHLPFKTDIQSSPYLEFFPMAWLTAVFATKLMNLCLC